MKRVKIQLSGIKDIDLIALHQNKNFNLPQKIHLALKSFAEGRECNISIPPPEEGTKIALKTVQINIPLYSEDTEVFTLLSNIKNGCRSAAIKAIFRNYLSEPYMVAFFKNESKGACVIQTKTFENRKKEISDKPIIHDESTHVDIMPEETSEDFDIFSDGFIDNL